MTALNTTAAPPVDPPVDPPANPPVDPPADPPSAYEWAGDLKGSDALSSFKGTTAEELLPEIAKAFIETKTFVGADVVKLPSRTAEQPELDKFYKSIGRPDEASGYELPKDGLPEGFKMADESVEAFRALAHSAGLNPTQAATLYRGYAKTMAESGGKSQADRDAVNDAAIEAVQQEFGASLPQRAALNKRLISQFDDKDQSFTKMMSMRMEDGMVVGNHPAMNRIFSAMSKQLEEDQILGAGIGAGVGVSVAEAKEEITKLKLDKEFMKVYDEKTHPDHKSAMEKMTKLYKVAFPG